MYNVSVGVGCTCVPVPTQAAEVGHDSSVILRETSFGTGSLTGLELSD